MHLVGVRPRKPRAMSRAAIAKF